MGAVRSTGDTAAMLAHIRSTRQRPSSPVSLVIETADQQLADFSKNNEQAACLFGIGAELPLLIGCSAS